MNILQEEKISHDELVEQIFVEYNKLSKRKVVSLFLSGLSSGDLSFRSGLSVYAIMQSFPRHQFQLREGQKEDCCSPCEVCSDFSEIFIDLEPVKECFEEVGGIISHTLLDYYYYLYRTNDLEEATPTVEDIRIFSEIIETISSQANENDTIKKNIFSKIGIIKGLRTDAEQRKALLETLGYCGILETEKHKGLLNKYVNLSVAPSKTHSSDWHYPVDFWLGKDGINKEALRFWFSDYSELSHLWT